ncbi:hypothetical protein, partial [Caballeronia sp. LZ043]|uniref:hypothetical protein n=1 Tax=Caballeronia sp. LZ043 TaxID=3038569 RepID=UPI00285CA4FF
EWLMAQRKLVAEGSAIAKALDYSLKRWGALTRWTRCVSQFPRARSKPKQAKPRPRHYRFFPSTLSDSSLHYFSTRFFLMMFRNRSGS